MTSLLEGRALVVLHKLEASLATYDVQTGRERFRVPTGPFPHEMCLGPDRRHVFVSEYGLRAVESEGEGGSTVGVFDLRRAQRAATIGLGHNRRPHGIAAHFGGRLFVTCEPQRALLVLRIEDHSVLHAVDVEQDGPHVVAVSPDGRTAFTANIGAGTITAVDVAMGEVLRHVKVESRPEGMVFSPDGRLLYVVNRDSASLTVVDTTRLDVVSRIETGRGPARIVMTPNGRHVAVSLFHDDSVQVVDVEARALTHTIRVGPRPAGTTILPDGRVVFVSCEDEGRVYAIDVARGGVIGELETGEGPGAMLSLDLGEID